jgi:ketosteroid isomerase-like protein
MHVTSEAPTSEALTTATDAWIDAFTDAWRSPGGPDLFADRIEPWLHPDVRMIQPQLPGLAGRGPFRERFVRPLFELMPDLSGHVERSGTSDDGCYVELTLTGTLGGRPVSWRVCDRMTLRDGLVIERESYFDPSPVLRAALTRPRAWRPLLRFWIGGRS